jgi:membrane protein YqaA with SNARE-associated domain
MLRRLYDKTMDLAQHPHATGWLAVVSFVESSVFPIPPDVVLIPMVLADRRRAWKIATVCLIASVLGGILGYAIGYFLYEAVGKPLVEFYGYVEQFARFQESYNEYGAWIVAFFGLTPFPYKVITIASGVTALNPLTFIVASVISRGARFFIVAALLWRFGPPIRDFIEKYLGILTVIFFVLLFGSFVAIKYLI